MRQYTKITFQAARRALYAFLAILLSAATLPLLFQVGQASALQLQSRSVTMSDSSASGGAITTGVGSGTNVTYKVSFNTTAAGAAGSMVIDFCSQSPIIDNACAAPSGMSAAGATLNATAGAGTVQTTTDNWAVTASASQIKLADDNTGTSPTHDMQTSTTETFSLSGITNPTSADCPGTPDDANCPFYARIYTYTGNNYNSSSYGSATSVGTYIDYGGIALSTTNPITITATVQEQLSFCVSSTDAATWTGYPAGGNYCSATNLAYPSLTLGHGSPTLILDTSAVDAGFIYTDLSTNATHGAVINMRNSNTTCTGPGGAGGLSADGGTTCAIPPVNGGAVGPVAINHGTAAFGMWCGAYAVSGAGTTGTVNCTSDYNDGVHIPVGTNVSNVDYGMDTVGTGFGSVIGTYGSEVAATTTPTFNAFDEYVFGATAGLTTPAGIYTAALSLVATGTF
jgi:hypothetical protein